jgi:DNA-binding transcriptional regulator YhcF (GntR family)
MPSNARRWPQSSPDDIDADYVPVYIKLARLLRGQIEAGEIQPHAILPSASELAAEHEVGTETAAHALRSLARAGYARHLPASPTKPSSQVSSSLGPCTRRHA